VSKASGNPTRAAIAVLLVALAGLIAACGGGGDEAPDPAVSGEPIDVVLTRDELIAEADKVCAEVNAAVGTIDASEAADEALRAAQRADLYEGLVDRLEALGNPSDGSPPTAVIAAARALGDPESDAADLEAFQEAADEYGLSTCTEDPEAPTGTPSVDGDGADGTGGATGATPAPAPVPAPTPTPGTGGGAAPATPGTGGGTAPSGGISPG
jgi:hypothetical protein